MHAFVERHVPPDDVDDVVQQIFVVTWRRSAEPVTVLHAPVEQQRAWLYQTARFHVWSYRRGLRRRRNLNRRLTAEAHTHVGHQLDPRTIDALQRSILRLPRMEWELLEARYFDGLTSAELGHWLEITPEAARQRLARALDRLRTIFEREVRQR